MLIHIDNIDGGIIKDYSILNVSKLLSMRVLFINVVIIYMSVSSLNPIP